MTVIKKHARIAGLLYLLLTLTGLFSIMYVPGKIYVWDDFNATVSNIETHELLYRFGIMSNLISQTLFVFLVLALYHLLKDVNKKQALLMLVLVLVSVPISFLNMINQVAALVLLSGADFLKAFEPDQLRAQVMLFLNLYDHGFFLSEIFWGLWLIPFGLLVYKSGFIPGILGVLLIIACFGYLISSFTHLLLPEYGAIVARFAIIPSALGEFAIILWLLVKGAKN